MSDRERIRRPEPGRTDPVRNASGVFRGAPSAPNPPYAWPDDDPVGRAVRAGCDVVEQAVRRGFGVGRAPWATDPNGPNGPWTAGDAPGPMAPPWTTGQWVDTMAAAFTMWAQWVDGWSAAARSVMTGGARDPNRDANRDPWRDPWQAAGDGRPAPQPPAAGPRHVVVELRSARAASVQLDLSPGVTGAGGALEVHGLLAPPAAAAPPITDVTVALTADAVTVAIGSIEHHPAGSYAGAVLADGRACGTLTVRLS